MAFHHLAFATRSLDETHAFYTEVMGFRLVKAVANETPDGGWAKHVFYDTGQGELLAFWDLHDETIPEFNPAISEGLGLPAWVNHVAFAAASLDGRTSWELIDSDESIAISTVASSRWTLTLACGRATPTTIAASATRKNASGR